MVEGVLWTGLSLLALASAGPLDRFPRESDDYQSIDLSAYANYTANEVCFSDNEVFQKGDLMPNPGPCEECRCEPPSIVCQMVKCPVNNNGCRTIQRSNHCCPDYNCECDYNGQLYSDGERLDLPDQPCQVCYCKGGEVMCTSLTCYTRNDCEPQQVPGQCCPKYENCPLRDKAAANPGDKNIRARSPNKTANSPKREMQPWLLTNSALQTSSAPVTKRPGDTTTEASRVIVVSDWLTERKTTPEDSGQGSALHDVTKLEEPHNVNTERPAVITRSEGFTTKSVHGQDKAISPLDEVIFTRIDLLRGQEKNIASSSNVVSNLLEDSETTNVPMKFTRNYDLIKENKTPEEHMSSMTPVYSTTNSEFYVQEKRMASDENRTEQPSNSLGNGGEEESSTHPDITRPAEPLANNSKTTEVQKITEIDTEDSITDTKNNKSIQMPIKQVEEKYINDKVGNAILNDSSRKYEAKLDKSIFNVEEEGVIVSNHVTESNSGHHSEAATPLYASTLKTLGIEEYESENIKESFNTHKDYEMPLTELIESTTNEIESTTSNHQLNPLSSENPLMNIEKESTNSGSMEKISLREENPFMEHTTEIVTTEMTDTTTPYITEDHMVRFDIEPGKFHAGLSGVEEDTISNIKEFTTDAASTIHSSSDEHGLSEKEKLSNELGSANHFEGNPDDTTTITTESEETTTDLSKPYNPNSRIVVLSSEVAHFDIQEVKPKEDLDDSSMSHIVDKDITPTTEITTANVREVNLKDKSVQLLEHFPKDVEEFEATTSDTVQDDQSVEGSELISNVPPVLDLNSHVPFLIIGEDENSDSSDSFEDFIEMETTTGESVQENVAFTVTPEDFDPITMNKDVKFTDNTFDNDKLTINISGASEKSASTKQEGTSTEKDIYTTTTTSHIPLTPGDLKVLAEYLINEKIKPVVAKKDSEYIPNQWLRGNLTSEDNIASIMAAANVSIGIMNQTDAKGESMPLNIKETTSGTFDKDLTLKGNSLSENDHKTLSKGERIFDKYSGKHISFKLNIMQDKYLNDGTDTNTASSTDPTQDTSTSKPNDATASARITDNTPLQNISINSSVGKLKTRDVNTLMNKTNEILNEQLVRSASSTKDIDDTSTNTNSPISKEGYTNTSHSANLSNDSIAYSDNGVINNYSRNSTDTNQQKQMDEADKSAQGSLPDVSQSTPDGTTIEQEATTPQNFSRKLTSTP